MLSYSALMSKISNKCMLDMIVSIDSTNIPFYNASICTYASPNKLISNNCRNIILLYLYETI